MINPTVIVSPTADQDIFLPPRPIQSQRVILNVARVQNVADIVAVLEAEETIAVVISAAAVNPERIIETRRPIICLVMPLLIEVFE